MPGKKRITFTVRGRYGFPFDMLRYDQAWPTDRGASALSLVSRGENRSEDGKWKAIDVELATHSPRVTDDRWHSFGWVVVEQRTDSF